MKLTEHYRIDGKPLLVPDAGVVMAFADLDAAESGRDEAGFLHRIPLRYQLGSWEFSYSRLTQEECSYLQSILPQSGSFLFARPGQDGSIQSLCSLTAYSVTLHSLAPGQYRNMKFRITEC